MGELNPNRETNFTLIFQKMKFWSTALTVTLGVDLERHPRAPTREIGFLAADKRHAQLTEMFTAYNPMFNDRQYFAYGCNCLLLGDRPITDPSLGPPVDELDSTCKQYKDCNKCVREQFGEQCVSEFRSYNFISGAASIQCTDKPNTCERALCECDAKFARNHAKHSDVFNIRFHQYESNWNPDRSCPMGRNLGRNSDPQCCSNRN